jgi:hypothetical protein
LITLAIIDFAMWDMEHLQIRTGYQFSGSGDIMALEEMSWQAERPESRIRAVPYVSGGFSRAFKTPL